MHHRSDTVFSEYVNAGATVYTSVEHTAMLSRADQIVLQAVVTLGLTTSTCTIKIAIEHCGDGRNWQPKSAVAELSGTLVTNQTTIFAGGELQKPRPSLRFVRLAITLTSDIPAKVVVGATVRTFSRVWREPCAAKDEPPVLPLQLGAVSPERLLKHLESPLRQRTLNELRRLSHGSSHLPPAEQQHHIRAHLSQEARKDVRRWIEHLHKMPRHEKQQLMASAESVRDLLRLPPTEQARVAAKATALRTLLTLFPTGGGGRR